ncbi:MAG: SDR family oxidoreductase [Verrucomicrobiales bacterium]|nr:SDR family oxidoreductase [Verrucomicrobiales bacterium]MCP5559412.1 SDR family oxidoreductase [Verrucomicrobiaceae bacterium]
MKNYWVIGGAGWLGRPVVRRLASKGSSVLCADLPGRAVEWLSTENDVAGITPGDFDAFQADAIAAWVADRLDEGGIPDGVVNLTYASTARQLSDLTAEEFDRVNHGNLTCTLLLTRAIADAMASRGSGSIVLFSSMYGGLSPDPSIYGPGMNPNPIEYGVNKAGIRQMARYLAVHYGPMGVRCNSISPGPFPNATIQERDPAFVSRLSSKVPMGRVGNPEEIAGAVAFLLGQDSSFITGIDLPVDGGWTAW